MLNSIEHYKELGRKAAQAMNHRDISLYGHFRDLFSRGKALEKEQYKASTQAAYDSGFSETRTVITVERFK